MITYLCICAGCDPEAETPMPFPTPESREEWRKAHAGAIDLDGTQHLAFTYYDQPVSLTDARTPYEQFLSTVKSGE